jgi:hypothetical protein
MTASQFTDEAPLYILIKSSRFRYHCLYRARNITNLSTRLPSRPSSPKESIFIFRERQIVEETIDSIGTPVHHFDCGPYGQRTLTTTIASCFRRSPLSSTPDIAFQDVQLHTL